MSRFLIIKLALPLQCTVNTAFCLLIGHLHLGRELSICLVQVHIPLGQLLSPLSFRDDSSLKLRAGTQDSALKLHCTVHSSVWINDHAATG